MTQQNIENIIQENVQLHMKVSVLEEKLENVQRQLAWLKKQIFGRKTEQTSVIMAGGIQLSLLNEEISETEKNQLALEAGKLLVNEILYNTQDNTNKLL